MHVTSEIWMKYEQKYKCSEKVWQRSGWRVASSGTQMCEVKLKELRKFGESQILLAWTQWAQRQQLEMGSGEPVVKIFRAWGQVKIFGFYSSLMGVNRKFGMRKWHDGIYVQKVSDLQWFTSYFVFVFFFFNVACCESNTYSVETALWALIFSWASHIQYGLLPWSWAVAATSQPASHQEDTQQIQTLTTILYRHSFCFSLSVQ